MTLVPVELFLMSTKPLCGSLVKCDQKLLKVYIFLCSFLQTLTSQLNDLQVVIEQIGIYNF